MPLVSVERFDATQPVFVTPETLLVTAHVVDTSERYHWWSPSVPMTVAVISGVVASRLMVTLPEAGLPAPDLAVHV